MNHSLPNLFRPIATSLGYWLIARGLSGARVALKWAAGKAWPLTLLLVLFTNHANAGWFTRGPDPKTEAASSQINPHGKFLEAIEALSNERTRLAAHLEHLGTLASRDSAWAAAIQAAAPLLVAVAVLALGSAAIWLVSRSDQVDSQLAAMLVDEVCGAGIGLAGPTHTSPNLQGTSRSIDIYSGSKDIYSLPSPHTDADQPSPEPETQEGELPF
jgi:hypothetical protein